MVIGTPEYMSPEQALGKRGDEIDGRSDLYSLGVVMYRMLTGELPFKAETTVEMILQHLRTPPVPPHLAKPELAIPEPVSMVVMKALEKDREKRFSSGAEMAAAFKKARGSITLHSRKIDWKALSSASATFGAEIGGITPTSATPTSTATGTRIAGLNGQTSSMPTPERTPYRTSARIAPPPKEFPTRIVATLAVVVLVGGLIGGWGYLHSRSSAKQVPSTQGLAADPAPITSPKPAVENKPVAPTHAVPGPSVSTQKKPAERKTLTYDEQAKVIELDSLGDIDYNQGGCEKALPTYQQVLQIDPNDTRAYTAVQKCYASAREGGTVAPSPQEETSPHP
jgi:serine/threonine protein kinase